MKAVVQKKSHLVGLCLYFVRKIFLKSHNVGVSMFEELRVLFLFRNATCCKLEV
jgi:hypothetical protein